MKIDLVSRQRARQYPVFAEQRLSIEQTKRQRVLVRHLLNKFALKHYPYIFLDQRLRSAFGQHAGCLTNGYKKVHV